MLQLGHSLDHDFDAPLGLLSDCHRRIESFLNVLLRVAREFESRTLTAEAENALRAARSYFASALPRHTADEEESLFPRMRAAAGAQERTCEAIDRLESDHKTANSLHARADALLDDWLGDRTLSAPRARELLVVLRQLDVLYRDHIRVEDNEVFPLAAELLTAEDQSRVGQEMRARRADWLR